MGNLKCLIHGGSHSGFRHGYLQLIHHSAEQISVLRQIDDCRSGTKNLHTVLLQICCQVQRSLSAKLCNDAYRFLLLINAQYILQGQGLKIQFIGGIVVSGYGLRITVYDNGLKAQLLQCQRSVYAAVVKLDTLTNTVGATA